MTDIRSLTTLPAATKLDRFNRIAAVREDPRFRHPGMAEVGAFIEAFILSRACFPRSLDGDQKAEWWQLLHTFAGTAGRAYWARSVYRADLPRWEPDDMFDRPRCEATLTRGRREGEPCGKNAGLSFRITHDDGTWRMSGWCNAHRAAGDALYRHEAANAKGQIRPQPVPNRGGLLPSHLPHYDWTGAYRHVRSDWEPTRWGICANDWPTLTKVAAHEPPPAARPSLRLIPGGAA